MLTLVLQLLITKIIAPGEGRRKEIVWRVTADLLFLQVLEKKKKFNHDETELIHSAIRF